MMLLYLRMSYEESIDPGFVGREIFTAKYTKKRLSADGRYKLPDGVTAINKKGCKFGFEGKVIRTKEDL